MKFVETGGKNILYVAGTDWQENGDFVQYLLEKQGPENLGVSAGVVSRDDGSEVATLIVPLKADFTWPDELSNAAGQSLDLESLDTEKKGALVDMCNEVVQGAQNSGKPLHHTFFEANLQKGNLMGVQLTDIGADRSEEEALAMLAEITTNARSAGSFAKPEPKRDASAVQDVADVADNYATVGAVEPAQNDNEVDEPNDNELDELNSTMDSESDLTETQKIKIKNTPRYKAAYQKTRKAALKLLNAIRNIFKKHKNKEAAREDTSIQDSMKSENVAFSLEDLQSTAQDEQQSQAQPLAQDEQQSQAEPVYQYAQRLPDQTVAYDLQQPGNRTAGFFPEADNIILNSTDSDFESANKLKPEDRAPEPSSDELHAADSGYETDDPSAEAAEGEPVVDKKVQRAQQVMQGVKKSNQMRVDSEVFKQHNQVLNALKTKLQSSAASQPSAPEELAPAESPQQDTVDMHMQTPEDLAAQTTYKQKAQAFANVLNTGLAEVHERRAAVHAKMEAIKAQKQSKSATQNQTTEPVTPPAAKPPVPSREHISVSRPVSEQTVAQGEGALPPVPPRNYDTAPDVNEQPLPDVQDKTVPAQPLGPPKPPRQNAAQAAPAQDKPAIPPKPRPQSTPSTSFAVDSTHNTNAPGTESSLQNTRGSQIS